jgi:hypothetical protein
MNANEQLFVALAITTFLTLFGVYMFLKPRVEGFKDKAEETRQQIAARVDNVLLDVLKKAKHMSSYLTDTGLWKERIGLAKMSYMELARSQLKNRSSL